METIELCYSGNQNNLFFHIFLKKTSLKVTDNLLGNNSLPLTFCCFLGHARASDLNLLAIKIVCKCWQLQTYFVNICQLRDKAVIADKCNCQQVYLSKKQGGIDSCFQAFGELIWDLQNSAHKNIGEVCSENCFQNFRSWRHTISQCQNWKDISHAPHICYYISRLVTHTESQLVTSHGSKYFLAGPLIRWASINHCLFRHTMDLPAVLGAMSRTLEEPLII